MLPARGRPQGAFEFTQSAEREAGAAMCPYGGWAPDAVYSILPDAEMLVNIDLCGSDYDTKVFVYDQNLTLVACNDDFYFGPPCGAWVSEIERLPVQGGVEYFVIVDGYTSANGGCNTDWFPVKIPEGGVLEVTGDAEQQSDRFELGPQDCQEMAVVQAVTIGECTEGTLTVVGEPGSGVWLWVGPTTFSRPDGSHPYEYDYILWLKVDVVATEHRRSDQVAVSTYSADLPGTKTRCPPAPTDTRGCRRASSGR